MDTETVLVPQQRRSRDSRSRVIAAATSLAAERGMAAVTVSEVAERAHVSVGTIYTRVGNRANLLRVVHQEELERLTQSFQLVLDAVPAHSDDVTAARAVVETFLEYFEANAAILRFLIALGQTDERLRAAGREHWNLMRVVLIDTLRANLVRARLVSDSVMDWIFEVIYALAARRFDLGGAHPNAPKNDEPTTILSDRIAHTVIALLTYEESSEG